MKNANMYLVGWELLTNKKNQPFYVLHLVHNCRCYVSFANPESVNLMGLNCEANAEKAFYIANVSYYYDNYKMKVTRLDVQTE